MVPDDYQKAWHAESSQTRVSIDADLLQQEVRSNQRAFLALILRRDVFEIGVSLLMLPAWFIIGAKISAPWTWYLTVPVLIWISGFMLVDRIRHKQKPTAPGDPLVDTVKVSLVQVEHQIWLLQNVFWWYLLPPSVSIMAFFAQVTWRTARNWFEAIAGGGSLFLFVVAVYSFLYYINQRAVRVRLEPRRRELLALLSSLGDESTEVFVAANLAKSVASSRTLRRWSSVATACLAMFVVAVAVSGFNGSSYDGPARSSGPAGDALAKLVTELRQEKQLVGLAAMVTVDGQVEAAAAQGERKQGSGVPVQLNDRWHLGGITKSITATMIARLIESGQMQWTDTVGDSFTGAAVHESWKPVTLRQLLTDTAGAPANFPRSLWFQRPAPGLLRVQARRDAVLNVIAEPTAYPPGEKNLYSNVSCTIAAAMAEQATGKSWEDLVKREVFEPLQLTQAGFGPPTSSDKNLEQPRGHRKALAGKVAVDDQMDNSPIMGPSGSVHMTLQDLCTYANEHLQGDLGRGKLLSAETYKLLHRPELDRVACGWIRNESGPLGQPVMYWHNGSNTLWYALVAFVPEEKRVVAVTANDGDMLQAEMAALRILAATANALPRNSATDTN